MRDGPARARPWRLGAKQGAMGRGVAAIKAEAASKRPGLGLWLRIRIW